MSDLNARPPSLSFWFSALIVLGCFLIFAFVLYVAYLPSREKVLDPVANLSAEKRLELNLLTPKEREERLRTLRETEREAATTYAWIDKEKGVVRLPTARAVELTVQELGKGGRE